MSGRKKDGRKDKCIGNNMRRMRLAASLSQKDVAARLGVTYQQVQKYERGESRLSAAMLHELSLLYKTSREQFFYGLESNEPATLVIHDAETLKIIAALSRIPDLALKSKLRKIVEILGE